MLPYEIILKKRNGQTLNRSEIRDFVRGFSQGRIPDYHMAAFLMVVYFQSGSITQLLPATNYQWKYFKNSSWGAGIRTPITRSRVARPAVGRHPKFRLLFEFCNRPLQSSKNCFLPKHFHHLKQSRTHASAS